jgi:hypothetical protein
MTHQWDQAVGFITTELSRDLSEAGDSAINAPISDTRASLSETPMCTSRLQLLFGYRDLCADAHHDLVECLFWISDAMSTVERAQQNDHHPGCEDRRD